MKIKGRENTLQILFMLIILVLAVVYFTLPERTLFIENQMKWWGEFWDVFGK
ncbi:MAG: hypothetical protein HZA14_12785 [Nitrospirae bacterium]|nr:hypothetical protein [Nitrospirota bacterium]